MGGRTYATGMFAMLASALWIGGRLLPPRLRAKWTCVPLHP